MRHALRWTPVIILTALVASAPAAGSPAAADFQIFVVAGPNRQAPVVANGSTTTVSSLAFYGGLVIDHNGGGEEASARVSMQLADGLRWGADAPDASEQCTATQSTAACQTPVLDGANPAGRTVGWVWNIVADGPGSYVLRVETVSTSATDPDLSTNMAATTVVVTDSSGGGSGGSGGGGSASVAASAARLFPAKPKAGGIVTATVRVTAGGVPVTPARVVCSATAGGSKLRGTPRARSGAATCRFRPLKSAKGKTLRGSVAFTAQGTRFTKRFAARLG